MNSIHAAAIHTPNAPLSAVAPVKAINAQQTSIKADTQQPVERKPESQLAQHDGQQPDPLAERGSLYDILA